MTTEMRGKGTQQQQQQQQQQAFQVFSSLFSSAVTTLAYYAAIKRHMHNVIKCMFAMDEYCNVEFVQSALVVGIV